MRTTCERQGFVILLLSGAVIVGSAYILYSASRVAGARQADREEPLYDLSTRMYLQLAECAVHSACYGYMWSTLRARA
jgi:hypothetical protein